MTPPTLLLELVLDQYKFGKDFVREEFRRRITQRHLEVNLQPVLDVHTDFGKAFKNLSRFQEEDDEDGETEITVEVVQATDLTVPSGKIVVCDPTENDKGPFERMIPPGKYPIVLSVGNGDTVVAAKLQVEPIEAVRWERATWLNKQGHRCRAYGVETGTGCFVDFEAAGHLDDHGNIPRFRKRSPKNPHAALWSHGVLAPETGANVITFATGGDGGVASYWGLDSGGEVVALVSDVTPQVEEKRVLVKFPRILYTNRGELRHELLDRIGVIMEVIPNAADQTLTVGFFGPKTDTACVDFEDSRGRTVTPKPQGRNVSGGTGYLEEGNADLDFSYQKCAFHQKDAEVTLMVYLTGKKRQL
jgi:hypothetical protein